MATNTEAHLFQPGDYIILLSLLLLSAGVGLFVSTVKHKQTSLVEYFLAGKNVPLFVVILSYFSTYAAGGMTGTAVETYLFGAQMTIFIVFIIPISSWFMHYLVVPVFYRLQNISMLSYFEIRFGRTVCILAMVASCFQMVATGSVNLYVAAISIHQVSAVSFWVGATIMAAICIVYSTLGGMRSIVIADTIQAIVMIVALVFMCIMAIIRSGGPKEIWDINSKYQRLQFNMSLNPTIRYTLWTTVFGYNFMLLSHLVTNQSLLQRCLMAPDLKAARKLATIGSLMTFIYLLFFEALGLVMFGYFTGCNVTQTGYVNNINQLLPRFAMDILHPYTLLPGIYFSGILCATLSTISSLLNSIPAIIMTYYLKDRPHFPEQRATYICKILVAFFGGVMFLELILIEKFNYFSQASFTLISVISGPTFALFCIGIFCPLAKQKCVAVSFCISIVFGVWLTVGVTLSSYKDESLPFANCTSTSSLNHTLITNITFNHSDVQVTPSASIMKFLFPLSTVSYVYVSLEVFIINLTCLFLLTLVFGQVQPPVSKVTLVLIPHCVRWIQLKLSRRMRRLLLCDVYGDEDCVTEVQQQLMPN